MEEKVEKLKKGTKKNGGKRAGSGRKPKEENLTRRGIKAYLDSHYNGDVTIEVVDPKTGKEISVKKPRVIVVLEKLYQVGTEGKGDADALNKWLDRALGKPLQKNEIGGPGGGPIEINNAEQKKVDAALLKLLSGKK